MLKKQGIIEPSLFLEHFGNITKMPQKLVLLRRQSWQNPLFYEVVSTEVAGLKKNPGPGGPRDGLVDGLCSSPFLPEKWSMVLVIIHNLTGFYGQLIHIEKDQMPHGKKAKYMRTYKLEGLPLGWGDIIPNINSRSYVFTTQNGCSFTRTRCQARKQKETPSSIQPLS